MRPRVHVHAVAAVRRAGTGPWPGEHDEDGELVESWYRGSSLLHGAVIALVLRLRLAVARSSRIVVLSTEPAHAGTAGRRWEVLRPRGLEPLS